ncbi:NACHT domain-containing protein [Fusarium sp. LHS14.1]|nr:NACHT domain-containing protein [Fusarium sp. LHS14.1]
MPLLSHSHVSQQRHLYFLNFVTTKGKTRHVHPRKQTLTKNSSIARSFRQMGVAESLRASGDDLWSAAIRTLGHELTSQIDFAQSSKKKTLDELLAVTDQERKRLVDKSWSFKRKDGEVVFVRDLLAKAAKWVNHFKAVGDTVVQYDPVHAALPWAGVRFLLNSQTAKELNRALVKLYASILAYLAKAKSYYEQNSLKRVVKHGILASSDLESAFIAISEAQTHVDHCATSFGLQDQLESHAELKRMLKNFDAPMKRWDEALHAITDQLNATRRTDILRWISQEPYRQHHEQTKREVLKGTGKWLLQDATFLRWKNESASSILWLHGIPGSGKSKLASIVVEDALEAFRENQTPAPVYFYCSRNPAEPGRSDPSKIAASIARQLSTPKVGGPLLEAAVEVYRRREAEDTFASGPLRLDESKSLILKLLEQYRDVTMTIVIDALDECNPATRGDLLDTLEDLLKTSPCLLKIFVSSRTDQDIVYKLDNYPNLHLSSDRNSPDIDLFVHSETKRLIDKGSLLRFSTRKKEIRDRIIDELTSKAQGMFRWASLQLQALCQQTTDAAILERLGRLPRTLAELYQEILANIENLDADADRQLAQNAFSWLLCAQEQLSSDVFLAAVSVTKYGSAPAISRDQLLQLCCNLIIFDSAVDAFRFSHLSVREFLEHQEMYKRTSANALVAEACLFSLDKMAPEASPRTPLMKYSCLFWAEHAHIAAQERRTRVNELLRKFLSIEQDPSCFHHWHRTVEEYLEDPEVRWSTREKLKATMSYIPRVLLVICAYDLSGILSPERWRGLAQERPRNKNGATHEEVAARYGSSDILHWHFNNGIAFEVNEKVVEEAAGNSGSGKEILALLLDKRGAEIQITEGVVEAAAGNYESGKEILALLLKARNTDTIAAITDSVCFAAASCGQLDFLHYLCQHIPPMNIDATWDSIARFYQAAQNGDADQLNQLLHEPIPFDTRNSKGQTPLWIAAFNRRTDIVSILVREIHVDVNSLSVSGQSPLFWPSAYGYEDVVNILVSAGAKSHFIDADGRTAISMARHNGHKKIVRILDSQSAQRGESVLVGRKPWWRQLSLGIGLILLGFIFSTFCI